jgi:hypothetical protein
MARYVRVVESCFLQMNTCSGRGELGGVLTCSTFFRCESGRAGLPETARLQGRIGGSSRTYTCVRLCVCV